MTTEAEAARATEDTAKKEYLYKLIELWNSPGTRQNWVLQAVSNCILGDSEGFQKNVYRHLIKRMLDPTRVDFDKQVDSLVMLGEWRHGKQHFPKEHRKHKGRAWWTVRFPHFNLVGRGNRPRTVLNSAWKTTRS